MSQPFPGRRAAAWRRAKRGLLRLAACLFAAIVVTWASAAAAQEPSANVRLLAAARSGDSADMARALAHVLTDRANIALLTNHSTGAQLSD